MSRAQALTRAAGRPVDHDGGRSLELESLPRCGWIRVRAPEPAAPFWREHDGTRHSYGSLRCELDPSMVGVLGEVHLEAIGRIARAALAASERGDQGERARLAMAAGRLCQEIAGHWPPSAVEVPRR